MFWLKLNIYFLVFLFFRCPLWSMIEHPDIGENCIDLIHLFLGEQTHLFYCSIRYWNEYTLNLSARYLLKQNDHLRPLDFMHGFSLIYTLKCSFPSTHLVIGKQKKTIRKKFHFRCRSV